MNDVIRRLFSLEAKVALVTGASGGIGRELAIGLAGAGAVIALNGRSREQLDETRRQIEAGGGRCIMLPAELADLAACRALVEDAARALGRLDILVNCAGMNRRRPIEQVTEDDFETIVNVNLRSLYFLSQHVHPIMRRQGGGKIIHVASLTSSMALGCTSVYGLTKAAVAQLARTQAVEWARDNIQVNCLAPGFTLTPLTEKPLWGDEKKRAWMLGRIPAKRPGKPEEMVGTVIFLSAQASSYLTGQMITVDGGALAGGSWED
jgi:gluconate 5-dehydrogenase